MNLQLAQKHYQSRFLELRDLIMAEELKFKSAQRSYTIFILIIIVCSFFSSTILREIEEIKNLRGETINQRQEEEEEDTRRDMEGKEEEEASKEEDDREGEEENKEGEDPEEEIKLLEEKGDQEEMETNVIAEEGEGEESKEEGTEADRVAVDNSQEREGEGEEGEEEETEATAVPLDNSQEGIEEGEGKEKKEEETEASPMAVDNSQERHGSPQEQDKTDEDHEQDDQTNVGNNAELDMGSESEISATPADIPASPSSLNLAEVVDDEHTSGDEHVIFTRRVYFEKNNHIECSLLI